MLYEEALYTVLHWAGTMGPDQVDDQEVLLSYLQQVSKAPPTHPASLWGGLRCVCAPVPPPPHTHWCQYHLDGNTKYTHQCALGNIHSGWRPG